MRRLVLLAALLPAILQPPTAAGAEELRARELLNALGCKACHRLGDDGGTLGPPLDRVGRRLDQEQIRRQLTDPASRDPATRMPAYDTLPEQDLQTLSGYLATLE